MSLLNSGIILTVVITVLLEQSSCYQRMDDVCRIDDCRQTSAPRIFTGSIGSPNQLNGMKNVLDLQAGEAAAEAVRLLKEMVEEATKEEDENEESEKVEAEKEKKKLEEIKEEAKNEEKHVKRQLKNPPIELFKKKQFNYDLRSPAERMQQLLSNIQRGENGDNDENDEPDNLEKAVERIKEIEKNAVDTDSTKPDRLISQRSIDDDNNSAEEDCDDIGDLKERLSDDDGGEEDLYLRKGVLVRLMRPVYRLGLFKSWE